ncbi:MAG: hypothetical protein JXR95_00035 [Deltaproteobacteria bacterium]|nr:hypothetical protein [Deltaproteobacteria bacterium]
MWLLIFLSLVMAQGKTQADGGNHEKPRAVSGAMSSSQILKKATQEALGGNHREVIKLLRPLLFPSSKFTNEEKEVSALRVLGLAFWFLSEKDNATQTFTILLTRRPTYILDPVIVPSGAIEFFNGVKKKLHEKLSQIKKRQAEEMAKKKLEEELARKKKLDELKKSAPVLKQTITLNQNYYIFNLFPLGIGQFQNGQSIKGWLAASTQMVAGLVSVGAYTYLRSKYPRGLVPHDEVGAARQIQYLQVGSGAAFLGFWIISVVDAVINFKPSRRSVDNKFIPGSSIRFDVQAVDGGGVFGISGVF